MFELVAAQSLVLFALGSAASSVLLMGAEFGTAIVSTVAAVGTLTGVHALAAGVAAGAAGVVAGGTVMAGITGCSCLTWALITGF